MADVDLGSAKGRIEIDASGAKKSLTDVSRGIDELDSKAKSKTEGLFSLSKAIGAVGLAGAAGFGLAIKTASDFQKTMSGVKAVTGANTEEMEVLRQKALQLGADTVFSAGDAAFAMEELAKAGIGVEEILSGAADATVALAAAGGISLPEAATIAANAMNTFGLAASDLPHIADLIAGAANTSAIDVSQFGLSMQQAGAVADLVGLSFDDMAVAIIAMGNAGIRGSDAGTSIKTFLSNLQPVTDAQKDAFDRLGLSQESLITKANPLGNAFFDSAGKIKDMSDISGVLGKSLEGMSDAQKTATLEMLFGSDAIRAAAIIASTGADGFDELTLAMNGTSAADVAAIRMDNFAGSMEALKGSVETALIMIGDRFLPKMQEIAEMATGWVNAFGEMDSATQDLIVKIGVIGTASALAVGGLGMFLHQAAPVAQGIGSLVSGFGSLIGMLGPVFANPIGIAILAIAALAVGFYFLYTKVQGFRDAVDSTVDVVVAFAKTVAEWFEAHILPALREFADFFMSEILPAVQDFVAGFVVVVGKIVDWVVNVLVPAVIEAWGVISEAAVAAWGWIEEHVIPTVEAIVEFIIAVFDKLVLFFNEVLRPALTTGWDAIQPIVEFAFNAVRTVIETTMTIISNIVGAVLVVIMAAWNLFGDNIVQGITIAFDIIKGVVEFVLGIIRGIFQTLTGLITGDWEKFTDGLITIWTTVWDFLKLIVETALNIIKLTIETIFDGISLFFVTIWEAIKLVFVNTIEAIKLVLSVAWDLIKTVAEVAWNGLKTTAELIWNTIKLAITAPIDALVGLLSGAWESIMNKAGLFWDSIKVVADLVWDTIKTAITKPIKEAIDILQGIWDTISGAAGRAWDAVRDAVMGPINAIIRFVQNIIDKVREAIEVLKSLNPFTAGDTPITDIVNKIKAGSSAAGRIVTSPFLTWTGEKGPEAIIPLNDKARALQLLSMSGLDRLLLSELGSGGGMTPREPISASVISERSGPAVAIDTANFYESADVDMLIGAVEFAVQGGRF